MEQLTSVYERIGEAIGESLESVCSMQEEERRELIITLGLEDTVNRIEDRAKGRVKDDPDPGKLTVIQRIAAAIGETVENVTKLPGAEIGQLVRVLGLEELAAQEDEEHVDSGGPSAGSAVIDVADLSSDDRFFNTLHVFFIEARSLQWSDFGKKVGNPTKCPILVRIWWDF